MAASAGAGVSCKTRLRKGLERPSALRLIGICCTRTAPRARVSISGPVTLEDRPLLFESSPGSCHDVPPATALCRTPYRDLSCPPCIMPRPLVWAYLVGRRDVRQARHAAGHVASATGRREEVEALQSAGICRFLHWRRAVAASWEGGAELRRVACGSACCMRRWCKSTGAERMVVKGPRGACLNKSASSAA